MIKFKHLVLFATGFVLLAWSSPALAKPPTLTALFPAGAQRGQTVEVTASGSFGHWPVRARVDWSGVEIEAGDKETLRIKIAEDAAPGLRWIRLLDDEGATEPRPFLIGTLPEVVEVEPNDDPKAPQVLDSTTVVVNGKLAKSGDVDGFAVSLRAGQTLVASMEANQRLGSPMDGVLQIASPEGFVLAQNDDDHGSDPQLIFEAPSNGRYLVRAFAFPATPNSSIQFAGGPTFIYRLTLTTAGFLDHVEPIAVLLGESASVTGSGWNIPEEARTLSVEPATLGEVGHALLGNTADLLRVSDPVISEAEPNDLAHPQTVPVPIAVSGRIDPPQDLDVFQFSAKKGEKLVIRVESSALGHPLDPVVRLTDAAGKTLVEMDDPGSGRRRGASKSHDPELPFTAPADGDYRVQVRDLHGRGGPRFAYLLSIAAPRPEARLALKATQFTLKPGKPIDIPITVERLAGFDGTIEISLDGDHDGLSAPTVTSEPKGNSAKAVTLKLTAEDAAPSGTIRIVGKIKGEESKPIAAQAPIEGFNASIESIWLTIPKPKAKPESGDKDAKDKTDSGDKESK
ncbi:MAG: PPC domain-containing protein [Isosphaeraceae bacterium]